MKITDSFDLTPVRIGKGWGIEWVAVSPGDGDAWTRWQSRRYPHAPAGGRYRTRQAARAAIRKYATRRAIVLRLEGMREHWMRLTNQARALDREELISMISTEPAP
jgi:hypothetical protein